MPFIHPQAVDSSVNNVLNNVLTYGFRWKLADWSHCTEKRRWTFCHESLIKFLKYWKVGPFYHRSCVSKIILCFLFLFIRLYEVQKHLSVLASEHRVLQERVAEVQTGNQLLKQKYDSLLEQHQNMERTYRQEKLHSSEILENMIQLKQQAAARMNHRNEKRVRSVGSWDASKRVTHELYIVSLKGEMCDYCTIRVKRKAKNHPSSNSSHWLCLAQ